MVQIAPKPKKSPAIRTGSTPRLPQRLKTPGGVYNFIYVQPKSRTMADFQLDNDNRIIRIRKDLAYADKRRAVWEAMMAVSYDQGIVTASLYIVRENPQIMRYITWKGTE